MQEISWLAEDLLASQEDLCSMDNDNNNNNIDLKMEIQDVWDVNQKAFL